jgi:hypothetical protein
VLGSDACDGYSIPHGHVSPAARPFTLADRRAWEFAIGLQSTVNLDLLLELRVLVTSLAGQRSRTRKALY